MDEKKNTSVTFFLLMGIAFIGIGVYAFIIAPNQSRNVKGNSDLVLESPVTESSLRYIERGIVPFCEDGNEALSIEVEEGTTVYAAAEGTVRRVENGVITVEFSSTMRVEYSPMADYYVNVADFVLEGDSLGKINGSYLNLRVNDTKRQRYECPYSYFDKDSQKLLDKVEDVMGYEVEMCECNTLDY